jgi:hypothetical protein
MFIVGALLSGEMDAMRLVHSHFLYNEQGRANYTSDTTQQERTNYTSYITQQERANYTSKT